MDSTEKSIIRSIEEEDRSPRKEKSRKIDKKKLIIYSEIMKPKFDEF